LGKKEGEPNLLKQKKRERKFRFARKRVWSNSRNEKGAQSAVTGGERQHLKEKTKGQKGGKGENVEGGESFPPENLTQQKMPISN